MMTGETVPAGSSIQREAVIDSNRGAGCGVAAWGAHSWVSKCLQDHGLLPYIGAKWSRLVCVVGTANMKALPASSQVMSTSAQLSPGRRGSMTGTDQPELELDVRQMSPFVSTRP